MWIVCITSVRHVLTVNGYGGRQTKENEKSWCFKGWETLVYIILLCIREMDEHTCYILSLRSTFLQTVNMTSKNILLEYSIKRLMIAF